MGTDRKPVGTKKTQLGTDWQENAFHTQKHDFDLSSITFFMLILNELGVKGDR
jgi:hypothetical protein